MLDIHTKQNEKFHIFKTTKNNLSSYYTLPFWFRTTISLMMEAKSREVRSLVQRLSSISEQTQIEAICQLRLLSKNDPNTRSIIAESGVLPILTESLYSSSAIAQENSVATLLNLSLTDSNRHLLMSTRGLLDSLSYLLRLPSATPSSLQTASATLYSLLTVDSFRPIIGSKRDILFALIDIIRNPNSHPRSIKDALKALFGVSLYSLNRATMVDLGVVPALFALVVKDGRVGIVEDSTAVIAQVAGCYESADAFRKVSGIWVLVDLLDTATGSTVRVRENAVSALLNLIQSAGDHNKVVEDVRDKGLVVLLDGIADVKENGSEKAQAKATALFNKLNRECSF